eukprot:TRINITY_DN598_c0_g1_i2.p1 TRINITY_DN598_c0_g1~~TRINITY_DN598_c0_g1_i2.p1  ORF type:complete len:465 (-),score=20.80 TRINITY_DN598_c0_g1_i2:88-1482(-)
MAKVLSHAILLVLMIALANGRLVRRDLLLGSRQDQILELPFAPRGTGIIQYSGFISVNSTTGKELFYWLVEAETDAANKPLIMWLGAEPTCSAVGQGYFQEIGPFKVLPSGRKLIQNPNSWHKLANLLFVDILPGTGFSTSSTPDDYVAITDSNTTSDLYTFLDAFYRKYTKLQNITLYLTGDDYGGHYVPLLGHKIHHANEHNNTLFMNISGYITFSPDSDICATTQGKIDFWWSHLLISEPTYESLVLNCSCNINVLKTPNTTTTDGPLSDGCAQAMATAGQEAGSIDSSFYYGVICSSYRPLIGAYLKPTLYDACDVKAITTYLNLPIVKNALHVRHSNVWSKCSTKTTILPSALVAPVVWNYEHLFGEIPIWIVGGDADGVIPATGTRAWVDAFRLANETTLVTPWAPITVNGQVIGHGAMYTDIVFISIVSAGHLIPATQPERAYQILSYFISHQNPFV